jgi:hypothetical protein
VPFGPLLIPDLVAGIAAVRLAMRSLRKRLPTSASLAGSSIAVDDRPARHAYQLGPVLSSQDTRT